MAINSLRETCAQFRKRAVFAALCLATCVVAIRVATSTQASSAGEHPISPAATIIVNSTSDVANSSDGLCTLREAITAANTDTASGATPGECAAGNGSDTINFIVSGTIVLTSALPDITSDIALNGPGISSLTIQRSTANGTPAFRIFRINVTSPHVVSFSGLSITNGGGFAVQNQNGPGIDNLSSGQVNITNCLVANQTSYYGGSIANEANGTVNVVGTTVSGNHGISGEGGGIANFAGGIINISNSTISGNSDAHGAAILNYGVMNVVNCTIANNVSIDFGSVQNRGTLSFVNTTISDNSQGLRSYDSSITRLRNTIIARNQSNEIIIDPGGPQSGRIISQGHNLIGSSCGCEGFTIGTNNANGDIVGSALAPIQPLIGALANNGGPTQTMAVGPGSPALDAGDNCVTDSAHCGDPNLSQLTTDQRGVGFNRLVDGDGNGTATVDIGAFESRGGFSLSLTSGTPQSTAKNTRFANPLVVTVNSSTGESAAGGVVTFTAPASGPSARFSGPAIFNATIGANQQAIVRPSANGIVGGPYNVTASGTNLANSVFFSMSNTAAGSTTPTTTVTSDVNPSDYTQSVTFTAKVTSGSGTPTGTVQFHIDGLSAGSPVTLNASGQAQLTTSALFPGTHVIEAEYSGDSTFTASTGILTGGQTVKDIPTVSVNDVSISEGDVGTKPLTFTVTLSAPNNLGVTVNLGTLGGTAQENVDYTRTNTILFFGAGEVAKTVAVPIIGDTATEPDETFTLLITSVSHATIAKGAGIGTILNDDSAGTFTFSQSNYNVNENAGAVTINVNRIGDTSTAATVDYSTDDTGASILCGGNSGKASSRCDFTTAAGSLSFGPGEASKSFVVLLTRDSYSEGPETFSVNLSNVAGGVLGTPSSATVTIQDAGSSTTNAIDDPQNFVVQHYHDFLNREPDASGLAFWTNQITSCGNNAQCVDVRRVDVSAAFFLSIEFQNTGYFVERLYKAAFGDVSGQSTFNGSHSLPVPIVRFNEFLRDSQNVAAGVIVLQPGWENQLELNKQTFALAFVQRSSFTSKYATSLTPAQFVDALYANTGVTPTATERDAAIAEFGGAADTANAPARARVLRRVVDNSTFTTNESNRAFVLMQYFGYLRRNPNDAPDADYTGYDFWLTKLNQFNGDYIKAEMVKAFITAGEYRQRFGP